MLAEIAAAVRDKRVSAVELVAEALGRIEAANPAINAVVALRAEEAMAEAADHPGTGALAGVPFLVKDLEDVSGMVTTYGSLLHAEDAPKTEDTSVVRRLRAAGAIPIGKTNTPEFAYTAVTANRIFGVTRNPWNTDKSPAGSSGGSAAAYAAGMAPLCTSSDGGGSTRLPASQTGLVGLKPTFCAYGRARPPAWPTFSANGSLGASVADVVLEATVSAGPEPGDPYSLAQTPSFEPVRPTRVVACADVKGNVDDEVAAAFEDTLAFLSGEAGLPVEHVDTIWDDDLGLQWFLIAAAEIAHRTRWAVEAGRDDEFEAGFNMIRTAGTYVEMDAYLAAQEARFAAARRVDELVAEPGTVLVMPTTNAACWPAEGPLPMQVNGVDVSPTSVMNTMELNFTMHPAVAVPMGIGSAGVPLSLQAVAPNGADGLTLGLAAVLEQGRPWALTAPGYDPFPTEF
ncbi:MAG: amidase [Acidimicrobiia bacterium]